MYQVSGIKYQVSSIRYQVSRTRKMSTEENECQVCYSTLNKTNHKKVTCPNTACKYDACITCIRTYLIANPLSAPHCMACKKQYTHLYLVENLKKTWVNTTYKNVVSAIQVDVELSKLSESMEEAERIKRLRTIKADLRTLELKLKVARLQISSVDRVYPKEDAFRIKKYHEDIAKKIISKMDILYQEMYTLRDDTETKIERKQFVMPCSYKDCKGMLSTQYKCGLCEKYTCKDCQEPKEEEEHKCNPDSVATAAAIKKETRPCPSCHSRIYKIEGCDQMWCTNCKTPFSWDTGKIVPAGQRLHNPHAIDYLRNGGGGIAVRAPGDLVCGGLISNIEFGRMVTYMEEIYKIYDAISATQNARVIDIAMTDLIENVGSNVAAILEKDKDRNILGMIRGGLVRAFLTCREVSNNILRETREVAQSHTEFNTQRVKYILGETTRDAFKSKIARTYKTKNINTELSYIWELVSTYGIEMFALLNNFCNNDKNVNKYREYLMLANHKLIEFDALMKYVNTQLAIVSTSYSCMVLMCNFNYYEYYDRLPDERFESKKYTNKQLKTEFNVML